jgi:hypothetical protein
MLLNTVNRLATLMVILFVYNYGRAASFGVDDPGASALNSRVAQFELTDATIIDGLSKLSDESITGLHVGIEEIIQDKASEHTDRSVRFSVSLHNVSVRDIVDTLCKSDRRYTWSIDGGTVNIYPRETVGNSSYLLNRELDLITLRNINEPSDALTSLMKLLPGEQLGCAQVGLYNRYPKPWSTAFSNLTVRQLMNRLSEHDGPRGGWIWSGSQGQRFFAYFERGFKRF